jgi:hypothetical protein
MITALRKRLPYGKFTAKGCRLHCCVCNNGIAYVVPCDLDMLAVTMEVHYSCLEM